MSHVPAGSRLVLRTAAGSVVLRALDDADLRGPWALPVLASVSALDEASGVLELATPAGLVTVEAHLVAQDGRLELRQGPSTEAGPVVQQRREDVRGAVELPLRGAFLTSAARGVPADGLDAQLEGRTTSVSGGGLSAELSEGLDLPVGARLYLELDPPEGGLVPCVVTVVASEGPRVRVRFVDIAPRDRERLVRLVFAQERRRAAERLKVRG